jgi:hypothetical protein
MYKIKNFEFGSIDELMNSDITTSPRFISDVCRCLWEEATDRELDFPDDDCWDFVADCNPSWGMERE